MPELRASSDLRSRWRSLLRRKACLKYVGRFCDRLIGRWCPGSFALRARGRRPIRSADIAHQSEKVMKCASRKESSLDACHEESTATLVKFFEQCRTTAEGRCGTLLKSGCLGQSETLTPIRSLAPACEQDRVLRHPTAKEKCDA